MTGHNGSEWVATLLRNGWPLWIGISGHNASEYALQARLRITEERIEKELGFLRQRYPDLEYKEDGRWVHIPSYPLPEGWNRTSTNVAFQIPVGYPGAPPYGIYTPVGLLFKGEKPDRYTEPAKTQPPLPGSWSMFSWQPDNGQWKPTADPITGSNLLNWVIGFGNRFREGK